VCMAMTHFGFSLVFLRVGMEAETVLTDEYQYTAMTWHDVACVTLGQTPLQGAGESVMSWQ